MINTSNTSNEILFDHENNVAPLGMLVMESATELGNKINDYLVKWAIKGGFQTDSFLIENECPRFSSGDGKGLIKSTIRGKDLFIITDVGNYNCTYEYFGKTNAMSPDDHFQDLK
ncbi:MAG: ribose-phosphate pyrophosphokinase-like domain-containing protein, partial [Oscillospiraceae bacterium]|nr:ribose-phosphate pyrophosphokinase-like domain-containing protein [Oscillospiraceae bacterium]